MIRAIEFFEGEEGSLSMTRLLMFGSFLVTSYIMTALVHGGGMNEAYFSVYVGTFAGSYLTGKAIDSTRLVKGGAVKPPAVPAPGAAS